jgi:hypothetical protein
MKSALDRPPVHKRCKGNNLHNIVGKGGERMVERGDEGVGGGGRCEELSLPLTILDPSVCRQILTLMIGPKVVGHVPYIPWRN